MFPIIFKFWWFVYKFQRFWVNFEGYVSKWISGLIYTFSWCCLLPNLVWLMSWIPFQITKFLVNWLPLIAFDSSVPAVGHVSSNHRALCFRWPTWHIHQTSSLLLSSFSMCSLTFGAEAYKIILLFVEDLNHLAQFALLPHCSMKFLEYFLPNFYWLFLSCFNFDGFCKFEIFVSTFFCKLLVHCEQIFGKWHQFLLICQT